MRKLSFLLCSVVAFAAACGDDDSSASADADIAVVADATLPDAPPPTEFGGDRPVSLQVPSSYSADTPTPLVVALHGFFESPDYIVPLLGISNWYEEEGFLFIEPDGLANPDGNYYWNATDACCDFFDAGNNDVDYLAGLIRDISASYNVDPKRVYLIGHSNGGFMAHRMACEHADKIAAIISFAGAGFNSPGDCSPTEPVSVAQLHGTGDQTILYAGGILIQNNANQVVYPSAAATVANWAGYNGCDVGTEVGAGIDVNAAPGDETQVVKHTGCPSGVDAELWTMVGTGHIVGMADESRQTFWAWFQAHAKQ